MRWLWIMCGCTRKYKKLTEYSVLCEAKIHKDDRRCRIYDVFVSLF